MNNFFIELHKLFFRICGTQTFVCRSCGKRHMISRTAEEWNCICGASYKLVKFKKGHERTAGQVVFREDIVK